MEERTALAADVEHIREDVAELKSDVRRVDAKIDSTRDQLGAKIDVVRDELTAFVLKTTENFSQLRSDRMKDRIWWLLIAGSILGTMLTVMARGFKWF